MRFMINVLAVAAVLASAAGARAADKIDKIGNLSPGQRVDVSWRTPDGSVQSTVEYADDQGIARVRKPAGSKLIKYASADGRAMQSLEATGPLFITDQLDIDDEFPLFGLSAGDWLHTAVTLGEFDASRSWTAGDAAVFISGISDGLPGLTLSWPDGTVFSGEAFVVAVNTVIPGPGPAALLGLGGLAAVSRRRR